MTDAVASILVALITTSIPAGVTIYTYKRNRKNSDMHYARQSILQLILEDKVAVLSGKIPENYQAVMNEFDEYVKNGGDSYIDEKMLEYKEWYKKHSKEDIKK